MQRSYCCNSCTERQNTGCFSISDTLQSYPTTVHQGFRHKHVVVEDWKKFANIYGIHIRALIVKIKEYTNKVLYYHKNVFLQLKR